MQFKVVKVSDVTKNGNRIISLDGIKKSGFGTKVRRYLIAVKDGEDVPKEGATIEEDLSKFEITPRTFINDEGNEITLNWLS